MGGTRFLLCAGLLFLLHAPLVARADNDALERIRALTRGGATQLALRLLDQHQPPVSQADSWMLWEKERYALFRAQRNWAQFAARATSLPEGLPAEFVRWAKTEAARAHLTASDAEGARRVLRDLLWQEQGSRDERAEWRQLVIRSYLIENNVSDAHTALQQYRADFQVSSPAWRQLEATILIRAGKARDAYALIGDIKTHDGQLLTLLAGLQGEMLPPATVLKRALGLAEQTRNKPALHHQAWLLVAEAAARANDPLRRMYALERALTEAREHAAPDALLAANADDLWQAYERYAEAVGNEARLLVGHDAAWLKKAEAYKRDDALQARAFYAFLLGHAGIETRKLAQQRFTDSLIEDGRAEVLRALYSASRRYPDLKAVPEYARYRLADQALAGYDISFAARLMQGLENPPAGEDPDGWALRRARVLIYAGDQRGALQLLNGILAGKKKLDDAFAERFIQVLFDLQAAEHHIQVIALLEAVFQLNNNPRIQRETIYWTADSKAALGEHQQAAELYLRSATYQHPTGGDMWGQTARYHAAEELGKAGLTQDARLVYQALLRHADDAKQRAVIERNIQQLWLIEKKATPR
ncbi:MAG TPA: hypothetical protein VJ396_01575 [Acidiferrobacterales bacterium]|nr:hypothetical protein [Acidiferrobacterales bacterium]